MPCSPSLSLTLDTPVGQIQVESCEDGIHSIRVPNCSVEDPNKSFNGKVSILDGKADEPTLAKCVHWFTSYFQGSILEVNFPLCSQGITSFQQSAYKALSAIQPGDSITYSDLGKRLGKSGCGRAIGNAMGKNRHLMLVPCHRVIHTSGKMTKCSTNGFLRPALLSHEASIARSATNGDPSEKTEAVDDRETSSQADTSTESQPAKGRRKKAYIPAHRSGAYALLIALYEAEAEHQQTPVSKSELVELAQPYSTESMTDTSSYYNAFSSMKTLIKKELVIYKKSRNAFYSLSDQGRELAKQLYDQLRNQSTAEDTNESQSKDGEVENGSDEATKAKAKASKKKAVEESIASSAVKSETKADNDSHQASEVKAEPDEKRAVKEEPQTIPEVKTRVKKGVKFETDSVSDDAIDVKPNPPKKRAAKGAPAASPVKRSCRRRKPA